MMKSVCLNVAIENLLRINRPRGSATLSCGLVDGMFLLSVKLRPVHNFIERAVATGAVFTLFVHDAKSGAG